MKILHTVEYYYPSIGGMQEAVKQLSEHLVKLGHQVTVATTRITDRKEKLINGVNICEFAITGNAVKGLSGEVETYKEYLIKSEFDVITNFAAQQWATDIALPLLDKIKAKKVFVPTGFSGLYMPQYKEYFEKMKLWLRQYNMNIFLSNDYRDINFARNCGVDNITVIPNGASENEFLAAPKTFLRQEFNISQGIFLILHVGSHTGVKGHYELIEIFKRARIKKSALLIVANKFGGGCAGKCKKKTRLFNMSPLRFFDGKKIYNVSLSREKTVAAYKEADLFLFPSNIECSPIVLFESMASKTPFLTTDVGNASEIIEWSKAGLLLPTEKNEHDYSSANLVAAVKMLEEIYGDDVKRREMGESGFSAWQKHFTWEKIAKAYEDIYQSL